MISGFQGKIKECNNSIRIKPIGVIEVQSKMPEFFFIGLLKPKSDM